MFHEWKNTCIVRFFDTLSHNNLAYLIDEKKQLLEDIVIRYEYGIFPFFITMITMILRKMPFHQNNKKHNLKEDMKKQRC